MHLISMRGEKNMSGCGCGPEKSKKVVKKKAVKKVAKGEKTQKRQRAGRSKVTVPVGSTIWKTVDVAFHIFNIAMRVWKRISGNDNSP